MKKTALLLGAALTAFSGAASAAEGDVLVRMRGIVVAPTENSSGVLPTFPTGSVSVDNAVVPEIDFTYFLTDNIGAELILATSPHNINGEGALVGLGEIGDAWALPPTLTFQYHLMPHSGVRPYVGVGVNWTIFYSEDASASLIGALGPTSLNLDDSFGVAFQAGVDFDLTERIFMNLDVKYIQIDTTATLNSGGAINTVEVDLDPIVAGIGFGMRF